jgi:hypothetical protein
MGERLWILLALGIFVIAAVAYVAALVLDERERRLSDAGGRVEP